MKTLILLFLTTAISFSTPFVTVWKTTIANEVVKIPMVGNYDYDLNNDGTFETTNITGTYSHTFATAGNHTFAIKPTTGNDIQIKTPTLQTGQNNSQLQFITQWGSYQWVSMDHAFSFATELNVTATDLPDFSQMTSMEAMFVGCKKLIGNATYNDWNTSTITTMKNLFAQAEQFNQPIGRWNTSRVTNMSALLSGATTFNSDISNWDISALTVATGMLDDSNLSRPNYDRLLGQWSRMVSSSVSDKTKRDIINVEFGAKGVTYTSGGKVEDARGTLLRNGWENDIINHSDTLGDKNRQEGSPVITPEFSLSFFQCGVYLNWEWNDDLTSTRFDIHDSVTKELITSVYSTTEKVYNLTLDHPRDVYLVVVSDGRFQSYSPQVSSMVTVTYELKKGWNLISIASDCVDLSKLANYANGKLWTWDGSNYTELIDSQPTDAMWINVLKPVTVHLDGKRSNAEIVLTNGWNMVGPAGNCEIPKEALSTFSFRNNMNTVIDGDNLLQHGNGYWIFSL